MGKRRRLSDSGGFTLIELMVVVTILGILAAIALPAFASFARKAHYAEAKQVMGSVSKELKMVQLEEGHYPDDVNHNVVPQGITSWPKETPFNSTLDYDHWAVGSGKCYVQIAFWGESNTRQYPFHTENVTTSGFHEFGDNLILRVDSYECGLNSVGPVK